MDNQVGDFWSQDFFVVSHENDVWGYSSVVERMLCMYEVLGSIPSIASLNYLFPSVTFLYFRKDINWIGEVFPEMDNQVGAILVSKFFWICLDKDPWGYSSVVERMLCMYDVLGSIPSISSCKFLCPRFTFFFRNGQLGRSTCGVKIFFGFP